MFLAQELTIDAAGRFSHYNIGSTGTVFAWNVNGTYAPVRDLRFRAGYARAIRAPTQSDLYAPLSQTFLNGLVDPAVSRTSTTTQSREELRGGGRSDHPDFGGTTEPFLNRPASAFWASTAAIPPCARSGAPA